MPSSAVAHRVVTLDHEQGLHVVPCTQIAKCAREFRGAVRVINGAAQADATSMFDLLGLNAGHGSRLRLEADGDGAEEFLDRLVSLFEAGFNLGR